MVAQITREEVLEVYAVREMLDGLAAQLAALLVQCRDGLGAADGGLLGRLAVQCRAREPLFDPTHESAALHTLVRGLLTQQ